MTALKKKFKWPWSWPNCITFTNTSLWTFFNLYLFWTKNKISWPWSKVHYVSINILTCSTRRARNSTTCTEVNEVRSLGRNWSRSLSPEVDHLWHSCLQGTARLSSYLSKMIKPKLWELWCAKKICSKTDLNLHALNDS